MALVVNSVTERGGELGTEPRRNSVGTRARKRPRRDLEGGSGMQGNQLFDRRRHGRYPEPVRAVGEVKRKRRKYSSLQFKCYNCGGNGHIARKCRFGAVLVCFKCGRVGHSGHLCESEACRRCLSTEHSTSGCMSPTTAPLLCVRCGELGHGIHDCTKDLSQRMAALRCFGHGQQAHGHCFSNERTTQVCSNCGDGSHVCYECPKQAMATDVIAEGLKTGPRDPRVCRTCLEPGHFKAQCPLNFRSRFGFGSYGNYHRQHHA